MRTGAARSAFASGDVTASRQVHAQTSAAKKGEEDWNLFASGRLAKASIEAALEGAIAAFVVLAAARATAAGGVLLPARSLQALGGALLVALAFARVAGRMLRERAESAHVRNERKREEWELRNNPAGEKEEMVEIYTENHGLSQPDAEAMVDIMAKYPHFFVDVMMVHELEIDPAQVAAASAERLAQSDPAAAVAAPPASRTAAQRVVELVAVCVSFTLAGAVPLYACFAPNPLEAADAPWSFANGSSAAILVLAALGSLRSRAARSGSLAGGVEALAFGCCCASVALGVAATVHGKVA
jgi:hypothetical protein